MFHTLAALLVLPLGLAAQSDVYIITQNTNSFSVDITAGDALVKTDGSTTTTIYAIQTVSNGVRVALDLPNNRAFIMDNAGGSTNDKIFRVDLPGGALTQIYQTVSPYDSIGDIEYDATNERLYFTEYEAFNPPDALSYLDVGGSNARTAVFTDFANIPVWLALDIANNRVFINDGGDDTIYRVNLTTGTKTAILSSAANAYDIEWAPNSGRLYFVENLFFSTGTDRLAYISATGGTPTVIDSTRGYINSFAVDENAGFAYAIGSGTETVYQVNLSNGSSSAFYTGSQAQNPQGIAVPGAAPNTAPAFTFDSNNDGTIDFIGSANEDGAAVDINVLLNASDAEDDNLTWTVQSAPGKGSLGGFPATYTGGASSGGVDPTGLTYTPNADANGADSFTIRVSDGIAHDDMIVSFFINAAPDVTGITVADGLYGLGDTISTTVSFDQAITLPGAAPTIGLNVGGNSRTATYVVFNGPTELVFAYTVQVGDDDTNGIDVVANSLAGNMVGTSGGLAADLSHGAVNDGGETVDATAPTVLSIERATPTDERTNASSVTFRVTFSEVVTGVATSDFSLTGAAAPGASVNSVAAANATAQDNVWLVTVTGISSEGPLELVVN